MSFLGRVFLAIDEYDQNDSFAQSTAFASVTFGAAGFVLICVIFVSIFLSTVGLLTGAISLRSAIKRKSGWAGLAVAGIAINGIVFFFSLCVTIMHLQLRLQ